MKTHKRPQKEDSDFKFPPEALNGPAVVDIPDIARGLASCIAHLPEECRKAHSLALSYFIHMARLYPHGVAPRDLPPSEAQILLMALVLADAVGGRSHAVLSGKN
jgi:hypothetical protein